MEESESEMRRGGKKSFTENGIRYAMKGMGAPKEEKPKPEAPTEGCDKHKRFLPHCEDCIAPKPAKDAGAREFRELVGIGIGEASVCWDEIPTGVFESTKACAIVDRIVAAYEKLERELAEARADTPAMCAYCSFELPKGAKLEELQRHINRCEHHPLVKEINRFDSKCTTLRNELTQERLKSVALLEALEEAIYLMGVPEHHQDSSWNERERAVHTEFAKWSKHD